MSVILSTPNSYLDATLTLQAVSATPTLSTCGILDRLGVGVVNPQHTVHVVGDVVIYGTLSASGGSTFQNTVFTTTSALSVLNTGTGPALIVSQEGDQPIVAFYDHESTISLWADGHVDRPGYVGVKTTNPNRELTVAGRISATGNIETFGNFIGNLSGTASTVANGVYTTGSYNNPTWLNTLNYSKLTNVPDQLPLSGGTLTGLISGTSASFSSNVSATNFYGNGSNLTGIAAPTTLVDIRVYSTASTFIWTKLPNAKVVRVELQGAGGGGGSGFKTISGTACSGGSGGGGGGVWEATIDASTLSLTVSVTVGLSGAGGINGNGQGGGSTSFGNYARAGGGAGGLQGAVATVNGGGGGVFGGNSGGIASSGAGGSTGSSTNRGGPGGGSGGGVSTLPGGFTGGSGGSYAGILSGGTGGTGGGSIVNGLNGGAGNNTGTSAILSSSGGGGGGGTGLSSGTGGNGGAGGGYGAGGGGGGSALTTGTAGSGGPGSNGLAVITTYF